MRLAPEVGGRILTFDVKEGDRIEPGARILTLDPADINLAIDRARTEQASAEAQLRLVRVSARPEDVRQAEAQVEAPPCRGRVRAAPRSKPPTADLKRFELLLERKSGAQKQRDDAATRLDVAKARLDAASDASRPPQAALARRQRRRPARRGRRGPGPHRHGRRPPSPRSTSSSRTRPLTSPVGGIVTDKLVEAGEVVPPRAPVVSSSPTSITRGPTSTSPSRPCRASRMGQPATLYTDAGGDGIARHRHLHLAEGRVHAAQRADGGGARQARLPHPHQRRQQAGVLKQGMPVDADLALGAGADAPAARRATTQP